ncbi:VapE domain-containing protein [Nostoc punctiforme]|uniref:Virulence-associated E family protein n=1 Tax=Nostoc punctiforme (strain ATCC 29133 / PCC 73102) TaxID=63737 RepID=B2IUW1_NOSP7|nr:VapE domain-containing protein [Nostoc punctiforme]ACC84354.1 virulence-associated E family protein [Nostoc punctiforme PCC 73102]
MKLFPRENDPFTYTGELKQMNYSKNDNTMKTMNNSTVTNYNEFTEFYQENIGTDSSFNFEDTEKFLSALCGNDLFTDFEEYKFLFQTFDDNEKRKDESLTRQLYGAFDECKNELVKLNNKDAGIFVTINQTAGNTRKTEDITYVRALYADCDKNGLPEHCHLEPSVIVNTSNVNGIQKGHIYWLLEDNEKLNQFKSSQQSIISHYESDKKVHDLPRVMRLPGFFHRKGEPQLVKLAYCNPSVRYRNQNEVIDLIPAKVYAQESEKTIPSILQKQIDKVSKATEGSRNNTLNEASFIAGGAIREGVIDEDDAFESLFDAASETGLPEKEISTTIKKSIKAGKDKSTYKSSVKNEGGKMEALVDIVTKEADLGNLQWDVYKETFIYNSENVTPNTLRIPLGIENGIDIRTEDLRDVLDFIVVNNTNYHYNAVTSYCDSIIEQYGMKVTGYIEQFCEILGLREPIERVYVLRFLIASVARAYDPGCYLDNVILFYGEQGLGKSKFFEDLYGKDYYATLPNETGDNDIVAACKSVWCGEIGEWERFSSKKSQAEIKTFITKPKDVMRKYYTQSSINILRRFVLFGTTNHKDILKDTTGNRRYWVCEITKELDRDWVAKNRDFIWAEAIAAYRNKEKWWLNKTEELAQKYHNENYTEESLPESQLVLWINNLRVGQGGTQWNDTLATEGFHLIDAITAIFGDKVDVEKSKLKITSALKKLKFYNKRVRVGGTQQMLWFHNNIETITGKKPPKTLTPTDMKVTFLEG